MENQTRFDLNAAIERWRDELAAQPNLAPDVRRELETHLRDTMVELRQRGLNDEEAFWLACRRIGQPQQLGEEFRKANPAKVWRERLFWMWLALFLSATLGGVAHSLALAVMPTKTQSGSSVVFFCLEVLAILIPLALAILLAKGKLIPQFSRLLPLVENRRRLAIAAFVCVVLSSAIRFGAAAVFYSRAYPHSTGAWVGASSGSAAYALVLGLVLVWLLPAHDRKAAKGI
jgi:hypothetical protein